MLAVVAAGLALTKGRPLAFVDHVFYGGAYLGNSITKESVVVDGEALLAILLRDSAFEDFRRVHPDFSRPVTEQIDVPGSEDELKRYAGLLDEFRIIVSNDGGKRSDATASRIVSLVSRYHEARLGGNRKIDDGALGGDRERPENFVFYLANAETACGAVAESSIALFRAAGYRSRLVILAHKSRRIQADHVLAEYFSEEQGRWRMIDPTVNFIGAMSVLDVLKDEETANLLNERHGVPHYKPTTTAVIDRRGLNRTRFFYTPDENSRLELRLALGVD